MNGIFQEEKECYFCRRAAELERHHIFYGTANRRLSEVHGFTVWLCHEHHTGSEEAVHKNRKADLCLKQMAQFYYEEHSGSREEFRAEFGKSYL